MSFKITLYKITLEPEKLIKINPKNEPPHEDFIGSLKEECDILNPVITVKSTEPLMTYNYCYIEQFGRYYYINKIDILYNNVYSIGCSVDVLQTYADDIKNLKAVIIKQESEINIHKMFNDGTFKVREDQFIEIIPFDNKLLKYTDGKAVPVALLTTT